MTEIRIQNYKSVSDTEVADAVLALAEPVLARCAGHFDLEKQFLSLAVTGWNLSLFPTTDEELSEAIAKRLPATLVEDQRVVFTGFLRLHCKGKAGTLSRMDAGNHQARHFKGGGPDPA